MRVVIDFSHPLDSLRTVSYSVDMSYLLSIGWTLVDGGLVDPQGATGEPMPLERALQVQAEYDALAAKYDEDFTDDVSDFFDHLG